LLNPVFLVWLGLARGSRASNQLSERPFATRRSDLADDKHGPTGGSGKGLSRHLPVRAGASKPVMLWGQVLVHASREEAAGRADTYQQSRGSMDLERRRIQWAKIVGLRDRLCRWLSQARRRHGAVQEAIVVPVAAIVPPRHEYRRGASPQTHAFGFPMTGNQHDIETKVFEIARLGAGLCVSAGLIYFVYSKTLLLL